MQLKGAHIIWSVLVEQGVDTVFGYPGGAILPAYDALLDHPIRHVLVRHEQGVDTVFGYPGGAILPAYDALLDHPIRHVLVRHEQGATHMADGYARASGRVGVARAVAPVCRRRLRKVRQARVVGVNGRGDWMTTIADCGLRSADSSQNVPPILSLNSQFNQQSEVRSPQCHGGL